MTGGLYPTRFSFKPMDAVYMTGDCVKTVYKRSLFMSLVKNIQVLL